MLKTITLNRLLKEGIPTNKVLPAVTLKKVRSAQAVARRINILGVFVAISNDPSSLSFFKNLLKEQNMLDFLSEGEKSILKKGELSKQEEIDISWYQESLYTLSWCLGLFKEMKSAKSEANLDEIFELLPPEVELEEFIEKSKLIEAQVILEELEYYYGLHWAVRHPESWRLLNKLKCKKYKMSVIRERRKALEWIIDDTSEWDDIPLNT